MKLFLKYLKKTLLVIGILLIAFALFLFIVGYFYGDKVKQVIVAEVSKRLNIEVTVKEIDFSLFKNFPEASSSLRPFKPTTGFIPRLETYCRQTSFPCYLIFSISYRANTILKSLYWKIQISILSSLTILPIIYHFSKTQGKQEGRC